VIVKPWREPGYTRFLRVNIGSREDNALFLSALANVLATR
jgi:histidinol-phosphate aminotransferase